jgi:hypothetical protein
VLAAAAGDCTGNSAGDDAGGAAADVAGLLPVAGADDGAFCPWPHPVNSSAMPIATAAQRKPAGPNGSRWERKDDARVIMRPPVCRKENAAWSHARIVPSFPAAPLAPIRSPTAKEQYVTGSTFADCLAAATRTRDRKGCTRGHCGQSGRGVPGNGWQLFRSRSATTAARRTPGRIGLRRSGRGRQPENGKPRQEPGPTHETLARGLPALGVAGRAGFWL